MPVGTELGAEPEPAVPVGAVPPPPTPDSGTAPTGSATLSPTTDPEGRLRTQSDERPAFARLPETPPLTATERERRLRSRLLSATPARSVWGWWGPLLVAGLAAALRLIHLDRPHELVFDETYYVKQAFSLLQRGYEARWADGADERFALGDTSRLLESAEYVVHPPLGKWLIAAGIHTTGVESAVGWRLSGALVGALTVLLLARIARRLFASTLLGCMAGLLLAVDGTHLVLSRTGILDVYVAFFALAAFGAVLLDRERSRARLAHRAALAIDQSGGATLADPRGPRLGIRWWLVAVGVLGGLATGVKWSGIFVLAVLGILAVAWGVPARRAIGARRWVRAGLLRDGVPAVLALAPVAALTYVATWLTWFTHPGAYLRQWAADNPDAAPALLPDALASWWEFHRQVWDFHVGLSSTHAYEAGPLLWIVQWRPTSFFWGDVADPEAACGAARCAQAITSLGNPVLWWAGLVGLVLVLWAALRGQDWRAWAILAGYAAVWLPWFAYPNRTTFTFYAVALAPFVVLSVTYLVAALLGWTPESAGAPEGDLLARTRWRAAGPWVAAAVVLLVIAAAVFFWPVWTGAVIPYEQWRLRMWLPSWI